MRKKAYPDCYLHVIECRSGETWIAPLNDIDPIDLRFQVTRWANELFAGELEIDGELMPKLDGDYYGKIMTDGRPPESVICWEGAGFFLKSA